MKQNKRCPECSSDKRAVKFWVAHAPKGNMERKLCEGSWHMPRKKAK